jgi:hypothetical protein
MVRSAIVVALAAVLLASGVGESMFRESSIPKEYGRLRFIFRKLA